MNQKEIEVLIKEIVRKINPLLPEEFNKKSPLSLPPVNFDKVDMVYLYMIIKNKFLEAEFSAIDMESGKFSNVADIADIVYQYYKSKK